MTESAARQSGADGPARSRLDRTLLAQLCFVVLVSLGWESVFYGQWLNIMDEGWPLHAAMRLHAGGRLYDDVFWVFPPGHLLPAWVAYALDPPGVMLARAIYSSFTVALCGALYLLGRRVMPPGYAMLGALLVAVTAPLSHQHHVLFGYRYLVFSVLALLAFDQRLRGRSPTRWMFVAGAMTGTALVFRLTPAFAVACGIGVGLASASRDPRHWVRDGLWYSAGLLAVAGPILAYFLYSVGAERLLVEVLIRPVHMTNLQQLAMPPMILWDWSRWSIWVFFLAVQFRLYVLLYVAIVAFALWRWGTAVGRRQPFEHSLLLAIAIWGGVYFVRSFGRSDFAHFDSAVPPVCLLLAWVLWKLVSRVPDFADSPRSQLAIGISVLAAWVYFNRSDLYLYQPLMGDTPVAAVAGRTLIDTEFPIVAHVDAVVELIRSHTRPRDTILNMYVSPIFHPLAGRLGPGRLDLIMPGTFLTPEEERDYLRWLMQSPPALVIISNDPLDHVPERAPEHTAPQIYAWVMQGYRRIAEYEPYLIYARPDVGPVNLMR